MRAWECLDRLFAGTAAILTTTLTRRGNFRNTARSHLRRNLCTEGFAVGRAFQALIDLFDSRQPLPFGESDQAHTLRVAPHDRYLIDRSTHQGAGGADEHELLSRRHLHRAHGCAVAIRRLQRNDTLSAAAVHREILKRRALAV